MSRQPGTVLEARRVFDAMPLPHIVIDKNFTVLMANDACAALYGRNSDELEGCSALDLFPGSDRESHSLTSGRLMACWQRSFVPAGADELTLRDVCLQPASTPVTVRLTCRAIHGEGERIVGLAICVQVVDDPASVRTHTSAEPPTGQHNADHALAAIAGSLSRVAWALTSIQRVEEVAAVALQPMLDILDAEWISIYIHEPEQRQLRLVSHRSRDGDEDPVARNISDSEELPFVEAIRGRHCVVLGSMSAAMRYGPAMHRWVSRSSAAAWVTVPIIVGPKALGCMVIGLADAGSCTPKTVQLSEEFAPLIGMTLIRLHRDSEQMAELKQSRAVLRQIQQVILAEPINPPNVDVAARYVPALRSRAIGGDWYDIFTDVHGTTVCVIGDTSGYEGDPTSAMTQLRDLVRGIVIGGTSSPREVVALCDAAIDQLQLNVVATITVATLVPCQAIPDTWQLIWCNAGHPAPLLVPVVGQARILAREPDTLIGTGRAANRRQHRLTLATGDTLVLYTDGLVDRPGAEPDYGIEELRQLASGWRGTSVDGLVTWLMGTSSHRRRDDVAVMAMQLRAPVDHATTDVAAASVSQRRPRQPVGLLRTIGLRERGHPASPALSSHTIRQGFG